MHSCPQIALAFSDKKPVTIREKFDVWIASTHGQEIEQKAIYFARAAHKVMPQYSMRVVIDRIRWHVDVEAGLDSDGYKVNNSHLPLLSRKIMNENRDLAGFFPTKAMKEA